jgi:hypothetical protein
VVLEVPESGDDVEAVGDRVASAALLQYLSVLSRAMTCSTRRRTDLTRTHLTGAGAHIVERDLLSMRVKPAYDRSLDLLELLKYFSDAIATSV